MSESPNSTFKCPAQVFQVLASITPPDSYPEIAIQIIDSLLISASMDESHISVYNCRFHTLQPAQKYPLIRFAIKYDTLITNLTKIKFKKIDPETLINLEITKNALILNLNKIQAVIPFIDAESMDENIFEFCKTTLETPGWSFILKTSFLLIALKISHSIADTLELRLNSTGVSIGTTGDNMEAFHTFPHPSTPFSESQKPSLDKFIDYFRKEKEGYTKEIANTLQELENKPRFKDYTVEMKRQVMERVKKEAVNRLKNLIQQGKQIEQQGLRGLYSINFLKSAIENIAPFFETGKVLLFPNYPLRIFFDGPDFEVNFILAPRVEENESYEEERADGNLSLEVFLNKCNNLGFIGNIMPPLHE